MNDYQMYRRHLAEVESNVREFEVGSPAAEVVGCYTRNAVKHACAVLRPDLAFDYEQGHTERIDAPFEAIAHLLFQDLFVLARRAGFLIQSATSFKHLCDEQPDRVPALIDSLRKGRRVDVLAMLLAERKRSGKGTVRIPRDR